MTENNLIEKNIKIAEDINANKIKSIEKLEDKLNNCPNERMVQTGLVLL